MPASPQSIRAACDKAITPTPRDKGLQMTLVITACDTGLIRVRAGDGPGAARRPIHGDDGWPGAAQYLADLLGELARRAAARTRDQEPEPGSPAPA